MSGNCIFVTGGAGYIGSHCVVELLQSGYEVVVIDNFVNSVNGKDGHAPSLQRVEQLTNKKLSFYKCDLLDKGNLNTIFDKHSIDCVIHFASIKAVGESMQVPLDYYKNNVVGTLNLLEVMKSHGVYNIIFSSSCCVYGTPQYLPINESHPTGNVTSVYGRTKYLIEKMLSDLCIAEKQWNVIALRYFNPVGAHPSGMIGEDPTKAFTNLMPYIAQVAVGRKPTLTIFGGDYDTVDGTGVRDYIHIMDLASGHVAAMKKLKDGDIHFKVYNLGTGKGVSVLQLIAAFENASGHKVPYEIEPRRIGDIDSMYADCTLAEQELNWKANYDLNQMCEDFWRWQSTNPLGYRTSEDEKINGKEVNGGINGH
uniref:UDP-glucose 4-epimerase n=1 Tax=Hemiscolopendra marginata TaxID=943146 RepID=A0A646QIE8_9MYRI